MTRTRVEEELRAVDLDLAADLDPDLLPPLSAMTAPLVEPADARDYLTNSGRDGPVIGEAQAPPVGLGQLAPLGRQPARRLGHLEAAHQHVVDGVGRGGLAQAEALVQELERLGLRPRDAG